MNQSLIDEVSYLIKKPLQVLATKFSMSFETIFKEEPNLSDLPIETIFDLSECCRTCLRSQCSLTPLNYLDSDSITFYDKLTACVSGMMWTKEYTSSFICEICIGKLRISYDFRMVCLQSDQALQLRREAMHVQSSRSTTPDPLAAADLVGCHETVENVTLSIKCEEKQVESLSQGAPVTLGAAQLECGKEKKKSGNKLLRCQTCNKSYTRPSLLALHMKTHSGEKLSCKLCNKKFTHPSSLNRHMKRHTGIIPSEHLNYSRKLFCKSCGKRFRWLSSLKAHMKGHIGVKGWSCHICSKSYKSSSYLTQHMLRHTGEGTSCKVCGQKFRLYSQLRIHMREHTGKQPYKCSICNKICKYSTEWQVHITQHTGEQIPCSKCDKKFTSKYNLNRHMKIHTAKNMPKCAICDRAFAALSHLKAHMSMHTGEKPFTCEVCDKSFRVSTNLTVHMRVHTGEKFSCNLCDRKYSRPSILKAHMMTHTDEKPCACEVCGKNFTIPAHLTAHMRTHTGEMFSCELCDKKYTRPSSLKAHMRKHTGEMFQG